MTDADAKTISDLRAALAAIRAVGRMSDQPRARFCAEIAEIALGIKVHEPLPEPLGAINPIFHDILNEFFSTPAAGRART